MQIMEDESEITALGKRIRRRKKSEKSIRVEGGIDSNDFVDITALIRSVQRTEGNPDCFNKSEGKCERLDCDWRAYCLDGLLASE